MGHGAVTPTCGGPGTARPRPLSGWTATGGLLLIGCLLPLGLWAQMRGDRSPSRFPDNPDYTGRFVFTRLRYGDGAFWGRGGSRWSHDYPRADQHLSRLLGELTTMRVALEGTNVLELDDPELYHHPVLYISEPGFWVMSETDVGRLREYVLKGGFLIFDDFEREQWFNLEEQLARALPEYRPIQIDVSHPVFHVFFDMETIDFPHPLVDVMPTYFGIFEDNDSSARMLGIINYDNDIAEYWEWSDTDWLPVDITNEAYKLGINYVVYALTH